MPYDGDEFFPDRDEREAINESAALDLVPYVAIRRLAYFLGCDEIGDACLEIEREVLGDTGADLDDYDEVIADAEGQVGEGANVSLLARLVDAEIARRERRRAQDIAKLASLRDDLRRSGEQ